jgi:MoaA/NifB/PqqE/SkfB family radical SAM enzyme
VAIRRLPMEARTLRRHTPSYPRTVLGLRSCQPFCFHPSMASLMVVSGSHACSVRSRSTRPLPFRSHQTVPRQVTDRWIQAECSPTRVFSGASECVQAGEIARAGRCVLGKRPVGYVRPCSVAPRTSDQRPWSEMRASRLADHGGEIERPSGCDHLNGCRRARRVGAEAPSEPTTSRTINCPA